MTTDPQRNLQLRRGIWYVRFTVAGVTSCRSLRTGNLAEAKRRAKPYLAEAERLRAAQLLGAPGRIWDDAVSRWRVTDFDRLRPNTRSRYETSIAMLNKSFGGKLLKDIIAPRINDFVFARRLDGACQATIRRDLCVANRIMKAALRAGWISINPVPDERHELKEPREAIRPVPPRDIIKVIQRASKDLAPLLRFAAKTGCRQEEAAALQVRDVDFLRRAITFANTKTKAPRVIDMTPSLERLLRACIPPQAEPDRHIFVSRRGGRFRSLPSTWRNLIAKSDVTPFRMHDLRHSFAHRWLLAGKDLFLLSMHLGHTSVRTTEHYARWLKDTVMGHGHQNRHALYQRRSTGPQRPDVRP